MLGKLMDWLDVLLGLPGIKDILDEEYDNGWE